LYHEITTEQMRLLTALFGERHDAGYDEETETNMRVRLNVDEMDRIVSVAFEDPMVVAN
jgi:hypothetical protein